jgi:hypothetical protein
MIESITFWISSPLTFEHIVQVREVAAQHGCLWHVASPLAGASGQAKPTPV